MSVDLEINCIVSCVVFIASILCDASCALDPQPIHYAPLSMRSSAIVLIACMASPPIRQQFVFIQRLVLATGLAAVALVGSHVSTKTVRFADVMYTFFIGVMTLSSYMQGGTESLKPSSKTMTSEAPEFTRRETVCSLAISALFYSSLRIVRQCIVYASNVDDFSISTSSWDSNSTLISPGYAYMSVSSLISTGFGGAVGFALSSNLLASNSLREIGTGAKQDIMLISAFFQFAAAFWATVALSEQQEELSVLFSASACESTACPASGFGRRFALLNASPAALWMNALGTFVLAYTPQKKESSALSSPIVVVWGMLSTIACAGVVFAYSSFLGSGIYVEISTLIAIAGVSISAFWNAEFGSIIFAAGIGYDEFVSVQNHSLLTLLTYLTHCSIFVGTLCLILRTIVVFVVELGWKLFGPNVTDILDDVVGVLTVAGMSIFTFLYLATLSLISTYDGGLLGPDSYEEPPNRYARSLVAAVLEHWLPILIFLPLYRTKQVTNLAFGWKLGVWIGSVVLAISIWVVALSLAGRDADHADAYMWGSQYPFLASIVLGTFVPWGLLSLI